VVAYDAIALAVGDEILAAEEKEQHVFIAALPGPMRLSHVGRDNGLSRSFFAGVVSSLDRRVTARC
jgi:hypothetical protein